MSLEGLKKITFKCKRCGRCCSNILTKTEMGLLGLYLQKDEVKLFPKEHIFPMYAVGTKGKARPRPKEIISYQLDMQGCPHYSSGNGCAIYAKRPLICRSFPLEIATASNECLSIGEQVELHEQFYIDRESVREEIESNRKHMEYLFKFKSMGDSLWLWTLDERKWKMRTKSDQEKTIEKMVPKLKGSPVARLGV